MVGNSYPASMPCRYLGRCRLLASEGLPRSRPAAPVNFPIPLFKYPAIMPVSVDSPGSDKRNR